MSDNQSRTHLTDHAFRDNAQRTGPESGFDSLGQVRFRLAIEASPAAMVMSGADGRIVCVNAATETLFGYCKQELIGKSVDILLPTGMRRAHAYFRQGFLAAPSKRPMGGGRDLKAVRRDGAEFPVEIGLTPIETGAGLLILATIVDVTLRREAEIALIRRGVELEKANERLAQFAYVASHDLQEPLRKIAAFSDLLAQAIACSNRSDIAHASHVMRTSALWARELVDDLLIFFRTLNNEQRLEELDLRREVEGALEELSKIVEEANAELDVDLPRRRFEADRLQFARLVRNIVSNAIKYRKQHETARVRIGLDVDGESVPSLVIADNGIGFESKYASSIFEPFHRLNSKSTYSGTGLGLAICKSIADRHGWLLSAKSQPGEGATFYVAIPMID